MTVILELRQPLWVQTPYGEGLAILLTDYGPESDHEWTCIQQEEPHVGELWTWHNSEVRVLANRSMLRGRPSEKPPAVSVVHWVKRSGVLWELLNIEPERVLGFVTMGDSVPSYIAWLLAPNGAKKYLGQFLTQPEAAQAVEEGLRSRS